MNGVIKMSKFIESVKDYLNVRNIRQTYVSLMTGWDKSRVSKVLNGTLEEEDKKIADKLVEM